jgi:arginyl-tRNA synthetase
MEALRLIISIMNLRKKIKEAVVSAVKRTQERAVLSGFDIPEIQLLKPKDADNGDYSLSIAMEIARIEKSDPMEIASEIKAELEADQSLKDVFPRIDAVSPGFINLYIGREYIRKSIDGLLSDREGFGSSDLGKGKKVQVEFISGNPTGPLTVGNGRGGPFGDTLANILTKAGYSVEKAYYVNDYGNQIVSLGHSVLKDADAKYEGDYIDQLNQQFKEESDVYKVGKESAKIILEDIIRKTTDNLNIHYDDWFSETSLHEQGLVEKVVQYLGERGFTYEKDNAIWFKSSDYGDERDRVIVKSDGASTYLAGDLAYHRYKFETKGFDKVINVWGADHFGDVPGLMAGIQAMGFAKDRLDIVLLQFVTVIKDGKPVKMSKRLGTAITMDDLLEELPSDVIRFFFLQKSANTHLNFDMALAKEQSDKNPVFYIQYAYARICSILNAAGIDENKIKKAEYFDHLMDEKEISLMREILKFPDVIEDTALDYQVHRLPQYALGLASSFHQFYSGCHCMVDDHSLREARMSLLIATKVTLGNVLSVMGISRPEKM